MKFPHRILKPILMALIFGALIGFARYQLPIYSPAENRPAITAAQFVNLVRTDPNRASLQGMNVSKFASLLRPHGADAVRDLTIYPTLNGKNYVRGTIVLSPNNFRPFQFNANNPFQFGPAGQDIRAFLAAECPKLSYRYAWWDAPTAQAEIWGGSSALVLGVVFLVASLFVSGGEKQIEVNLIPPPQSTTAPPAKAQTAVDQSKIDALNAMLEQSLAQAASPQSGEPAAEQTDAPVRSLSSVPDPVAPVDKQTDPKEYRGQYYPVSLSSERDKH